MQLRVWSIAFVALALTLRLWGIGFGLPALYHPDEPAFVLQALAVAGNVPNGLTFANPPLFKYVLLAEYAVDYMIQRVLGTVASPADFVEQFRANPSTLYLLARATSAVFGALTVVAAAILGTEVAGRRVVGLMAGGLTACTYLVVREAHFATDDALVTLLVTLGLIPCVRIAKGGSRRDYVAAGALAGLAFAAKYDGIVLLVPLLVAHLVRNSSSPRISTGRGELQHLGIAVAACVLAAIVTFPSLVIEPGRVISDIYLHLYIGATSGYDGLDPSGGYLFYARALMIGLGWQLCLAAFVGVLMALVACRKNWSLLRFAPGGPSNTLESRSALVVLALPVALLVVLGAQRMYFARFALPAVPALLVMASLAMAAIVPTRPWIALLVAALAVVPTLADAVRLDILLGRQDTRAAAAEWIHDNIPAGATLLVDAPPLGPELPAPDHGQVLVANGWSLFDFTPEEYGANQVDYIVVSSFTQDAPAMDPGREARRRAFPTELQTQATLLAEFGMPAPDPETFTGDNVTADPPFIYDQIYGPFNDLARFEQPGPHLWIYQLRR